MEALPIDVVREIIARVVSDRDKCALICVSKRLNSWKFEMLFTSRASINKIRGCSYYDRFTRVCDIDAHDLRNLPECANRIRFKDGFNAPLYAGDIPRRISRVKFNRQYTRDIPPNVIDHCNSVLFSGEYEDWYQERGVYREYIGRDDNEN